ncbi:MAG: hypothetical protein LUF34_00835 [Lachnospiraceae bacterium]|nr:hypothetical protein [Lachnospiraceae bacterium]
MRLKNVPGAREEIEASPCAITEPEAYRGQWQSVFPETQQLHVEICMWK